MSPSSERATFNAGLAVDTDEENVWTRTTGLLLAANIDAAFEVGLLSFRDCGENLAFAKS